MTSVRGQKKKKVHHAATKAKSVETLCEDGGGGVRGAVPVMQHQMFTADQGADMSGLPGKFCDSACFYWPQHNSVYHCSYLPQTQICTSCENTHKAAIYHPRFMKSHQSAVCLQSPANCAIMLAGLCLFSSVEGGFIATLSYTWYLSVNLLCRQLRLLTLSQRGYSIFIF